MIVAKKKVVETVVEAVKEAIVPKVEKEFTRTAFDIVFEPENKRFMLVTVGYDVKTKEAKVLKNEVLCAANKAMALHKGKEIVVKKIFELEHK